MKLTADTITDEMIGSLTKDDSKYGGVPVHVIAYRARWGRTERIKNANRRKVAEILNARGGAA